MEYQKKRFYLVMIFFSIGLVMACNKSRETASVENTEQESFKSYYDTLRHITAPIKIDWKYWDSEIEAHVAKYGPIKSAGILENPYGKIFDSKNYKAIIFISIDGSGAPTLITIDKNDNPIDTLFLLGDISSNDASQSTIEQSEIMNDKTITLVDTVFSWNVNADGDRISDSKRMTISSGKYGISDLGTIDKLEK